MTKRVERQVNDLLADAASRSRSAAKGTPLQQVGDVYAGGMDVERLGQLGAAPLMPEWERIAKIDGAKSLASALARLELITNMPVVIGASVAPTRGPDPLQRGGRRWRPAAARARALPGTRARPRARGLLEGHRRSFALAGVPAGEAKVRAAKVLEMETRIAGKKLTPVQNATSAPP